MSEQKKPARTAPATTSVPGPTATREFSSGYEVQIVEHNVPRDVMRRKSAIDVLLAPPRVPKLTR